MVKARVQYKPWTNKKHKYPFVVIALLLGIGIVFAVVPRHPRLKRTSLGHTLRWLQGETGNEQRANDFAEDVEKKIDVEKLRTWCEEIMSLYRRNELPIIKSGTKKPKGWVSIPSSEIPKFLCDFRSNEPDVSIHLSRRGEPVCVDIYWLCCGLLVGDPKESHNHSVLKEYKPGIYIYHIFR